MRLFRNRVEYNSSDGDSVIAACRKGNTRAQRALVELYYGYVMSIALRYSSGTMDAEEILNDTFLKVFTNLHKYDDQQPFKAWLRSITVNTAIDAFRKRSITMDSLLPLEAAAGIDFNEDIIQNLSAEEILALVQSLSPVYRMVFTLYAIEGYSHKEIAAKLGISEGTSKSNLRDARLRLQEKMAKNNLIPESAYELKKLHTHEE